MFLKDLKHYSMERIQLSAILSSLQVCSQCTCEAFYLQHTKSAINVKVITPVMLQTTLFSDVVFSNPRKLSFVTN